MTRIHLLPLVGLLLLPACVDASSSDRTAVQLPAPAIRTAGPTEERACLEAVARQTNAAVMVLSSEFSEANSLVMVGVGPDKAPWKCLSSNGVVAEITSLTNEGTL